MDAAEQKLIDAKAKLAQLEAELPYLIGQQPSGVDEKIVSTWLLKDCSLRPAPPTPRCCAAITSTCTAACRRRRS